MSDSAELARTVPFPGDSTIEDARLDYERAILLPHDLELEPITAEDQDYQSSPPDYRIATYPTDFTLEILHKKWSDGDIEVPAFQRSFVWKRAQASRLIESFLVGLPVPAIFLYNERETEKYFVIDGQQRLRSVFAFFEGSFPSQFAGAGPPDDTGSGAFRLTGLSPSSLFYNRAFGGLPGSDQRRLRNAVLRAFIVQQLNPEDDTSMYHIFERLNTGGTMLANQEIRNCIYRGPFVDFVAELNTLRPWRTILGKDEPDSRKRDIELIVRFFATRGLEAYQPPMKKFLSKYMSKNRGATDDVRLASRTLFTSTCEAIIRTLGERPFHRRSGLLNVAVLDAVMVAFSKNFSGVPDDISERYDALITSESFIRNTTQKTTHADRVQARFKQANEDLFGR